MNRGSLPSDAAAVRAQALAANVRQMVLNRDPRFIDLAAIVAQVVSDARATNISLGEVSGLVSQLTTALANNTASDQQTRAAVAALSTVIDGVQTHVEALADEDQRLGDALEIATAQLAAADVELSARLEAAEADIDLEALERAKADAAEARARADADLANQAKQQAADAAEASARAAADAVHNTRLASLENYMPGAVSGRATRPSLLVSKGQIIDIPVVFDNPLPDANYVPLPVLDTANVTNFTPVEYINKTKTGITARLRAEVLIAVAVTLNVTIFALKL